MMITMTADSITDKQLSFLRSLAADRDWANLPDVGLIRVIKIVTRPDEDGNLTAPVAKKDASAAIDALLKKCPKIAPITTAPIAGKPSWASVKTDALALLETVPASYKGIKYAVPNTDTKSVNTFVFYEVREYKGKRYLNRLQGAPGDWVRNFVKYADYAGIIKRIKDAAYVTNEDESLTGPMAAAARFSDMYTVCACCCSPLSNGKSLAAKFGPVCITKF